MIRAKSEFSDVVIKWPVNSPRMKDILRTGLCPSYGQPKQARRHAVVALIDPSGRVMLRFRLKEVVCASVIGANGRPTPNGCVLIAVPKSVRRPHGNDHRHLTPIKYPVGAIGYFDDSTGKSVSYGGHSETVPPPPPPKPMFVNLMPYKADNSGKELERREAELIERYRRWLGGRENRFAQGKLAKQLLFIDLWIRGVNVLIEAKMSTDRKTMRGAVGQLHDYRRFLRRRPRMAVLLPIRPSAPVCRFLTACHVRCIWETASGHFGDSVGGEVTRKLRRKTV